MKESSNCIQYKASCKMKTLESFLEIFMKLYASPASMLKTLDNERLKKSFQIAYAIENFLEHLGKIDHSKMWTGLIQTMLVDKKLPPNFDTTILRKACDSLLKKFFINNNNAPYLTDVAVRVYTSILPSHRYEEFLCDLLMKSASYRAIHEFIFENEDIDIKTFQFKLLLHDWILEYQKGNTLELATLIQDMMSLYKVEQSLYALIGIIALETDSEEESFVRTIVLKEVLDKMFCRSMLSRKFWATLFYMDQKVILKACELSEEFHVAFCNFLIFIGSMMDMIEDEGETKWMPNLNNSICQEFTYDLLVSALQPLLGVSFSKREVTMKKLLSAEKETDCELWRHLLKIL